MNKGKIAKGLVLFAIYIALFIFLIRYVSDNTDTIDRIMNASYSDVLIGILCSALSIALTGLMDVSCARAYDVRIGYGESIGLVYIASMINLILPLQMGSVVKAVYFKKKLGLTYSRYVSIISGTAVINIMITLVQIILCLMIVSHRMAGNSTYILIFGIVLIAMIISVFIAIRKQDSIIRILPFKRISTPIMKGFFELIGNKRAVCLVTVNLMATALIGGIRFFFIFRMLGFAGKILDGILYYGLYNASAIVPILPGNIGISEAFVGIMNVILGSEFDIGVTTVLINRVYYYITSISGSLIAALPLWLRFNKSE